MPEVVFLRSLSKPHPLQPIFRDGPRKTRHNGKADPPKDRKHWEQGGFGHRSRSQATLAQVPRRPWGGAGQPAARSRGTHLNKTMSGNIIARYLAKSRSRRRPVFTILAILRLNGDRRPPPLSTPHVISLGHICAKAVCYKLVRRLSVFANL